MKQNILLLAVFCQGMYENAEEVGISYIAAFLRKHNHKVELRGMRIQDIVIEDLLKKKPDYIGIPVYEINHQIVYTLCKDIKHYLPHTKIIVGGVYPTYKGKSMLKECPNIDYAIKGEGEYTMLDLIEGKPLSSIAGLTYRINKKIIENKDRNLIRKLDDLPFASRDMLTNNHNIVQVSTSRGCNGKCSFCASQLFWKSWRGRSPEKVVDELEQLVRQRHVQLVNFIDGSFEDPDVHLQRLEKIADQIIERNLKLYYFCHIRAEFHRNCSNRLMKKLRLSGLCGVCIGIESGNDFDLKLYKKIARQEDVVQTVELFRKYHINIEAGFINFNPYTTFKRLRENTAFLEKLGFACNPEHLVTICKLYEGTALYSKVKADGLLKKEAPYQYTMQEEVQQLHTICYQYIFNESKDLKMIFSAIIYFTTKYLTFIQYYRLRFIRKELTKEMVVLEQHEQNILQICQDLNVHNAQWFQSLIYCAETHTLKQSVDTVTNKFLSYKYLADQVTQLFEEQQSFYLRLTRLNPENMNMIISNYF